MIPFIPENYFIRIEPDLAAFTFSGFARIRGNAREPIGSVSLNALTLDIQRCRVITAGGPVVCACEPDEAAEKVDISLPEELSGEITLEIDYQGVVSDGLAGFYRSRYTVGEDIRHIAVTQFQESDARRAFPCLDHPLMKATFDIELVVDAALTALSNTAIAQEVPLENGKKQVRFQQTPKMSTYLVFFGVGEFEMAVDAVDDRVRAAALPGKIQYTPFGLEFGRKALAYCESYYGIPYPLPKMDLIAIPDFAFGAMENWGAITFRENLLLHYPDITSRAGEERICEVTAHEIAHQWFGNLVTPSDWKYLWLNESFATFFGYGVVDHYYPNWGIWEQFLNNQTSGALSRDGLQDTISIEIPGGEHVVINTSTAPIIYSKGASILRQIEGFIGKDAFKNGLRKYLETHAYDCALSRHLWEALEAVSDKPITAIMKSWVGQPGHPILRVRREGNRLTLVQQRFTYLPDPPEQTWLVPVSVTLIGPDGNQTHIKTLMDAARATLDIGEEVAAYKVNSEQSGFYRVIYENPQDLEALGEQVLKKQLSPFDRWGIEHDLYALVKSGQTPLAGYLDFLTHYENEDGFLPLTSIFANLFQAMLILPEARRAEITDVGVPLLERALERAGYVPQTGEAHTTSILRDQMIWCAVRFGSEKIAAFAAEQFNVLRGGGDLPPDILKSIMQSGAYLVGDGVFEWLIHRFGASESEHERMNVLSALGCLRQRQEMEDALQFVLEKVPGRIQFIPITAMAANPAAQPFLWDWYVSNLKALEAFHPMLYERVIAGIVPVCGIHREKEVKTFFEAYVEENPAISNVVSLSLEKLEINLRMNTGQQIP